LSLLFSLVASDAWAWGEEGHSVIAEIAQRRLSPSAAQAKTAILRANPNTPPYSTPRLLRYQLGLMRFRYNGAVKNETYNWHFVDIPRNNTHYDPATECPKEFPEQGDCVINELSRLRNDLLVRQARSPTDTSQRGSDVGPNRESVLRRPPHVN
jgi:hypothetical protein